MDPHPPIWPGVNSVPLGGDEGNSAGLNPTIDAVWWDAAEVFIPLVAQGSFWDDVDICIGAEKRLTTVRPENTTMHVRD